MKNDLTLSDDIIINTYNKYIDMVYRICFMMLKSECEAQDAVQNVFVKYIDYKKEFKSDEHLKAWFIVTAKNECRNMLKHWWRTKRVSLDAAEKYNSVSDGEIEDIIPVILKLDDKYRLPIYLYYYEGYSTSEIAEMLKINHSTLRTNLSRARLMLKKLLEVEN